MGRILLLGASGGLGQTFQKLLREKHEFEAHDRHSCNVTSKEQLQKVVDSYRPNIVINCAAYTAVDKAESEPTQAFAINYDALSHLTQLSNSAQFKLVHFSTDYVFDGKSSEPYSETSTPKPINIYGESKLKGDLIALSNSQSLVIRTSWLYSTFGKSFPEKILNKAMSREPLKVVCDQFSSPTYALDLAMATLVLLEKKSTGLFNYSCSGLTNWHEFASETISIFNRLKKTDYNLPAKLKTEDLALPAARPRFTQLNCNKIQALGISVRPWQDALESYLQVLTKKH